MVPTDVRVCMPGRGCTEYVPGVGQGLNQAITIGPGPIDALLAGVLVALLAVAAVAAVVVVRRRRRASSASGRSAGWLLIVGGALAAVPPLVPATAPIAGGCALASTACAGLGLVLLAGGLPRPVGLPVLVVGVLRLVELPLAAAQVVTAAVVDPLALWWLHAVGGVAFAFAALVLLVAGPGALRFALLPLLVAGPLAGIRLGLPFAVGSWIDLLPAVATLDAGLLVLVSRELTRSASRRRRAVWARSVAVALAASLVVLLAWPQAGVGAPAAAEPAIGAVRTVTAASRLVLPLDEYVQPVAAADDVIRAENALIRTCAAEQRVSVQAADLIPAPRNESGIAGLGLIDADRAASVGYWVRLDGESGAAGNDADLHVLASCVSAARARLGDDGHPQLTVEHAAGDAFDRSADDSRVRRVTADWSRCMQRRGFAYPDPAAVQLGSGEAEDEPFPTPGSTRTASADVACESATDLPGVRAAVLAAYQERSIAANRTELDAARIQLAEQARRAEEVLQRSS